MEENNTTPAKKARKAAPKKKVTEKKARKPRGKKKQPVSIYSKVKTILATSKQYSEGVLAVALILDIALRIFG